MALQINRTLTTKTGLTVPTGSYVWLIETRGIKRKYMVEVRVQFYISKTAFEAGVSPYNPVEVPDIMGSFSQEMEASAYASLTPMQVHEFVKAQLGVALGEENIQIVA